ncbi:MAG: hypothetical protein GY816_10760 [Cytophagales bacterium]|nr:hypothetical protein [Cytophagales bacterium]
MKTAHLFPDNTAFSSNLLYGLNHFGLNGNTIFVYFNELPHVLEEYSNSFELIATTNKSSLLKQLREYDRIVFHSIYPHYLSLFKHLKDKRLEWVFWGYEYYNYFDSDQFEPVTQNLVPKRSLFKRLTTTYIRIQLRKAYKEFDVFLFWDHLFFETLKQRFDMKAEFREFLYCRPFFKKPAPSKLKPSKEGGLHVYIGNSSHLTGNQPDVITALSSVDGISKVYALLAYGWKNHQQIIIDDASKHQFNSFEPITEFLPYEEYLEKMASVDVIICYHNRMQALGQIFNAIILEKALILNEKNNFNQILTRLGIRLFSFKDLNSPDLIRNAEILKKNKEVLLAYFNKDRLRDYYNYFD